MCVNPRLRLEQYTVHLLLHIERSQTGLVYLASAPTMSDLARTSERPLPVFCF